MSKRENQANDRAAVLAALRTEQKRQERRRTLLVTAVVVVLVLVLGGITAAVLLRQQARNSTIAEAASTPIAGVKEYPNLARNHVEGAVTYPETPPVGGDHSETLTNCAVYTTPVKNEYAVHSLEHGAVWVTYSPDLPADQVAILTGVIGKNPYGLLSPFPGLSSPVVASAWGLQLTMTSASDPRLPAFVAKYANGPQTPEPGAACSGGVGAS
ncbi:DUF3105 domain-containing protein [Cellulomonas sp. P24]|uniref:DUF3105 domain-containing protein n=1 Tax=Cellulomonas sp. P24 TaxID=2885206 RepID=UPI00216B584D|nr:DUF3105 domain-containing protein [Cellulomonas sp. P24]MCR6490945.1 DUF3105 domain-containing protein [Cellulomonas sp. P24]